MTPSNKANSPMGNTAQAFRAGPRPFIAAPQRRDLASMVAVIIGKSMIALNNARLVMAVLGFSFSALLAGSYECGLLDRLTVLPSFQIQPQSGHAYIVHLNGFAGQELIYPEDSNQGPNRSTLDLLENGKHLAPAHTLHSDIRALGAGRYSHWQGYLILSSSDNTDPRSNGRVYSTRQSPNGVLVFVFICVSILISITSINKELAAGGMAPLRGFIGVILVIYGRVSSLTIRLRVLATLSVIIALEVYFVWKFGLTPFQGQDGSFLNDGWFYTRFADQLLFAAGVTSAPQPEDWRDLFVTFFRLPGYPLIIAISKFLAGSYWQIFVVTIQVMLAALAGYTVFRVSWRISEYFLVGLACAALFILSHRIQFDRAILTDSLCASGIALLVCHAVMGSWEKKVPTLGAFLIAGLWVACLFLIRETTFVIDVAAVPLVFLLLSPLRIYRGWLARLAVFYLPVIVSLVLLLSVNYMRTGYLFVTTQGMSAIFTAILLEKHGTPVFTGENALDRTARETLKDYNYIEAMEINKRLFLEYRMSGPQQSALGQEKYLQIWRDQAALMIKMSVENLRLWPDVFVINELIDQMPQLYNDYYSYVRLFSYLCAIIFPLAVIALRAFLPSLQPMVITVSVLIVLIVVPSFYYAIMVPVEPRYLIFGTAPLLLIFAMFSRSVAMAFSHFRSLAGRHR